MNSTFLSQLKEIFIFGIKAELSEKDRFISPILFAASVLILFAFATGDIDKSNTVKIYLAESFLAVLFSLQLSFARLFEPDQRDRVFDLLRSYPLNRMAWFFGKYFLVVLTSVMIIIPTMLLAALLNSNKDVSLLAPEVFGIVLIGLLGMAALGVLLSVLTLSANGREILFPIIYFPLSAPILLSGIQASLAHYNGGGEMLQWVGLLLCFDIIYGTLAVLLFDEFVDS